MNDTYGFDEVAAKLRKQIEVVTRDLGMVAADFAGVSHRAVGDMARKDEEIALLRDKLDKREKELGAAIRNKERFRYALWVYLQERDGLTGHHAPTPETLTMIRELIQELQ